MTKNDKKYQFLTEEDLKIIKSDPTAFADYVIRSKVKDSKKNSTIVAMIVMIVAFGVGIMAGLAIARVSIPNNIVQVRVGTSEQVESSEPVVETVEEGK